MTAVLKVEYQPPCEVCGTDRQMQSCRPLAAVGRVEPCAACCGPRPLPWLRVPMRRDVPAVLPDGPGGAA